MAGSSAVHVLLVLLLHGRRRAEALGKETVSKVVGVDGGRAALPCDLVAPEPGDMPSLVLWYKDDAISPVYSLDARRGELARARHQPSAPLERRAYLVTSSQPAALEINGLRPTDEGIYRCRVDFVRARSRNSISYLKVIVPPRAPLIRNVHGEKLTDKIGPFNVGDEVRLICEVDGGRPLPAVTWWRQGDLLDDTSQGGPPVRNELVLGPLTRADLMAKLVCRASNSNLTAPVVTSVTLDLNMPPAEVTLEGPRVPLSAHKTVEVLCIARGSKPPAELTWLKDGKQLAGARSYVPPDNDSVTVSRLALVPGVEDGGKRLTCRAENPRLPENGLEDHWILDVLYAPQLELKLGSNLSPYKIQEGHDVYLECVVRANPAVGETVWRHDGREVTANSSAGVLVSGHSLVLQHVRRAHRGRYTCSASNSEGIAESDPFFLRVQHAPVCHAGQQMVYGAARHEVVQVTCRLDADPEQVAFEWRHSNAGQERINFAVRGTQSTATYIPRSERDFSTLYCWGQNSVGTQQEPCVFTITPAGPPSTPRNCTVSNHTEEGFAVECIEGYDGGLTQRFILEVYESGRLRVNLTADWSGFQVRGLRPDSRYRLAVTAFNSRGRSRPALLEAVTLLTPKSLTQTDFIWEFDLRPILIAVVVTIILLLVGLFLGVVLCRIRRTLNITKVPHLGLKDVSDKLSRKEADSGGYDKSLPTAELNNTIKPPLINMGNQEPLTTDNHNVKRIFNSTSHCNDNLLMTTQLSPTLENHKEPGWSQAANQSLRRDSSLSQIQTEV